MEPVHGNSPPLVRGERHDPALARAARDLEASFLSIMLKDAGVGAPRASFGGGTGEEQFSSFLAEAYADRIADRGGIGLAQIILQALEKRSDAIA